MSSASVKNSLRKAQVILICFFFFSPIGNVAMRCFNADSWTYLFYLSYSGLFHCHVTFCWPLLSELPWEVSRYEFAFGSYFGHNWALLLKWMKRGETWKNKWTNEVTKCVDLLMILGWWEHLSSLTVHYWALWCPHVTLTSVRTCFYMPRRLLSFSRRG